METRRRPTGQKDKRYRSPEGQFRIFGEAVKAGFVCSLLSLGLGFFLTVGFGVSCSRKERAVGRRLRNSRHIHLPGLTYRYIGDMYS